MARRRRRKSIGHCCALRARIAAAVVVVVSDSAVNSENRNRTIPNAFFHGTPADDDGERWHDLIASSAHSIQFETRINIQKFHINRRTR